MSGRLFRLLASLSIAGLVAGCSSTDMSSSFNLGKKKEEATPSSAGPVVVQGACPQVYLREGTAIYRQYAKGTKKGPDGLADPEKLMFQATLDQTTRQCFQTGQGLRVNVVVRVRVVLGPAGKEGTYTLPIRVAATNGDQTLYSELSQFQVSLAGGQGTGQFIFSKDNVMLTQADGMTRLFAGIDEGPYNTK